MTEITVGVEGMMCGHCEAHVNDTVRAAFPSVKKVTSSHSKGQTVILTEEDIPEDKLRETIDKTGYTVTSVSAKPYEEKRAVRIPQVSKRQPLHIYPVMRAASCIFITFLFPRVLS